MDPTIHATRVADRDRQWRPGRFSRRDFARLTGGTLGAAALAALLAACGGSAATATPPMGATRQAPTPSATGAAAPDSYGYGYAPGTPAATAPPAATAGANAAEVKIVDFGFEPGTLTVPVGTAVTWKNTGSQHTTTSVTKVWDSGNLATGATFSFTFAKAGSYEYRCTLHPTMKGTVEVR